VAIEREVDVIIVGAGLSGLTAAYHLAQAGMNIAVLEARDRIGGRIHTVTNGQSTCDLGPTWFWPHQRNVIAMIQEFGLHPFTQYETGQVVFEQGRNLAPQRITPNWEQPLSYRIEGGMMTLVNALAERLAPNTIHLQQIVQAMINTSDGHVAAHVVNFGEEETIFKAKHIIVTLPPQLAATTITYSPPLLPDLQQAMCDIPTWMGEAMKISLVYGRPFWRDENLSGMAVSYVGPVQQFHDATPDSEAIGALFGWVGNHSFGRSLSEVDRRLAVIEQAIRLFGKQAADPIHYNEINWEHEPFTTNLNMPNRVVATDHPRYGHPLLQQPQMMGHLWWATTEASPVEGGYLDGAISIGRTVAARIVQSMNLN